MWISISDLALITRKQTILFDATAKKLQNGHRDEPCQGLGNALAVEVDFF